MEEIESRPGVPEPAARRRSGKKRQAILLAATDTFLEAGYGAATMDQIAIRAGVSKQTVYAHFGSKEALFGAIIGERCERFLSPALPDGVDTGNMEETLRSVARAFMAEVLSESSLRLHRLIIGESGRFPELGRAVYGAGPARALSRLARFLATHGPPDGFEFGDGEQAAEQFFAIVLGLLQLRAILRGDAAGEEARLEDWIDGAVATFLAGHRE
jgi:TetR/AcrR family transcriptional repressor of mexJK operon